MNKFRPNLILIKN